MATDDEKRTSSSDYNELRREGDICRNNQKEAFNLLSSLGEIWESITNIKNDIAVLQNAREKDERFQTR